MRRAIATASLTAVVITGCVGNTSPPIDTPLPSAGESAASTLTLPVTVEDAPTTTEAPAATSTTVTTTTSTLPPRELVTLEVRSRESWGAKPPDKELQSHDIKLITIHHTARRQDDTPMEERLQRWQNYHQSIGFGDIAYHMVIAADGTIYQGRELQYVGSTRTSYDPTTHFLPAIDGMFDEYWDSPNDDDDVPDGADDLTSEQLQALIDILAWASSEFGIDPNEIGGHNDFAATACPGSVVSEMIHSGEIASRVQARIDSVDFELAYIS